MGQKVNPNALRLPVRHNWLSKWYVRDDKKFKDQLLEDVKIRKFVMQKLRPAGISQAVIERSAGKTTVTLKVSRPGMVIGRGGSGIEDLRKTIEKDLGQKIALNVEEIRNPDLDAHLVASSMAEQIERRFAPKRVMNQAVDRVMRAGALGAKVIVSGRLGGSEIARTDKLVQGSIPTSTLRALIDFAKVDAKTPTAGVVGVKVWIHKKEEKARE